MLRIALCDDDIQLVSKLKMDIAKSLKDIADDAEISTFSKGADFLEAIQKEKKSFDILFLDIDMPDISGLSVAKFLREADEDIIIIFISAYENYVFESLEYTPFRFIRKNRMQQELGFALKAAYALYRKNVKKYLLVRGNEGDFRIEQSTICYFEMIQRKIYLHLIDGQVISVWKTMKEFYKDVQDDNFVKIHSGCAVNLKYVKGYSNGEITLDNGEKLLASRAGMKVLKEELSRYWGECV